MIKRRNKMTQEHDYLKELADKYPDLDAHFQVVGILMKNAQAKLRDAVGAITEVKTEMTRLLELEPLSELPKEFKQEIFGTILNATAEDPDKEDK